MVLSWDLVSPVEYSAGEELSFNLHFEAPGNTIAKKFYILGALYTDTTYISGSLFGVLKAAEVDYGVNNATHMSLWELEPEEVVELPCRFILNRSNCSLALFLMRMVGDEVNLDDDEEVTHILVQLTTPVPIGEELIQSIIPIVGLVLVLGITIPMIIGMLKEE